MSRAKVVIMKDWLDLIEKRCSSDQVKEICYKLLQYGLNEKYEESEDLVVNIMLDTFCPQIDAMQETYRERVVQASRGGRPAALDNKMVWELAKQGLTGTDIAEKLGVPKSTVYSSAGWRNRNEKNYENFS
jgi:hypothetical protein